jgi:hypothetical protein
MSFDIPVEGWKNDCYIEAPRAAQPYYAELGLKSLSRGEFYLIKRSNVVETPKNTISPHKQEQWMKVVGEYESVNMVSAEELWPRQSPSANRKMIEEYYTNLSQKWQKKPVEQGNVEQENKEAAARLAGQEELSGSFEPSPENILSLSNTPVTLSNTAEESGFFDLSSFVLPSRPPGGSLSSPGSFGPSSFGPSSFSLSSFSLSSFGLSSLGLSSFGLSSFVLPYESSGGSLSSPGSFALSSGSYGSSPSSYSSLSSWQKERSIEELFRYDLDLVIYGKTQPGAILYIDENLIKIQPDGTFSWRLNLSQRGEYRIPVRVILPGGREIFESIPFEIHEKNGD